MTRPRPKHSDPTFSPISSTSQIHHSFVTSIATVNVSEASRTQSPEQADFMIAPASTSTQHLRADSLPTRRGHVATHKNLKRLDIRSINLEASHHKSSGNSGKRKTLEEESLFGKEFGVLALHC
jgi:hypothetical protein